jgi:hypothetical protein
MYDMVNSGDIKTSSGDVCSEENGIRYRLETAFMPRKDM